MKKVLIPIFMLFLFVSAFSVGRRHMTYEDVMEVEFEIDSANGSGDTLFFTSRFINFDADSSSFVFVVDEADSLDRFTGKDSISIYAKMLWYAPTAPLITSDNFDNADSLWNRGMSPTDKTPMFIDDYIPNVDSKILGKLRIRFINMYPAARQKVKFRVIKIDKWSE